MSVQLHHGHSMDVLKALQDCSIDAVVTDPPYHLTNNGGGPGGKGVSSPYARARAGVKSSGFMGMSWDGGDIAHDPELWAEVLRVAKPGAWLLAFGGTRTYHRLAVAIEDAGWELRDSILRPHMPVPEDCPWLMAWGYGTGFPKSKNLDGEWKGWGTALKPAWEPIVCARKPLIGTVESNVLQLGTGAINIDGCRVSIESQADAAAFEFNHNGCNRSSKDDGEPLGLHDGGWKVQKGEKQIPPGRWPANLIHDGSDEVVALFPYQTSGSRAAGVRKGLGFHGADGDGGPAIEGSTGSAARFFYCAKAAKKDRNEGLQGRWELDIDGEPLRWIPGADEQQQRTNNHPTVKPTALMRYLCRLVTPPGGVVLDPFTGSGSTGKAAMLEGFNFVGIEREAEYVEIARARISHAAQQRKQPAHDTQDAAPPSVRPCAEPQPAVNAPQQLGLELVA